MKRYIHDCLKCQQLGQYEEYDLYFCLQFGKIPTVIARYGSDGPDYMSGIRSTHIPLVVARDRAEKEGLIQKSS